MQLFLLLLPRLRLQPLRLLLVEPVQFLLELLAVVVVLFVSKLQGGRLAFRLILLPFILRFLRLGKLVKGVNLPLYS